MTAYGLSAAGFVKSTQDAINNGTLKIVKFGFDAGVAENRPTGAHKSGVILPEGALVVGGMVIVDTLFKSASNDTGTIAIHVESADDIVAAAAVSGAPYSSTGKKEIVPKINTPESTSILLTKDREITFTVAVAALTAGKLHGFLIYVAP